MDFAKTGYRTLVLSTNERFGSFLAPLFSAHGIDAVDAANNLRKAKRLVALKAYDLIFVNSPLPDGNGYRFALDASRSLGSVVLVALPAECYEGASEELSPHGIYLLKKPLSGKAVSTALDWMLATRARLCEIEENRLSLEGKMKELALINRAKWLLIDKLHMTEPEAHRHIEKQAMDRRISQREVAEEIIQIYG